MHHHNAFTDPKGDAVASAQAASTLFQPIVSATSLTVHGIEAVTRLAPESPYADLAALLDASAQQGLLRDVERTLMCAAIDHFAMIPDTCPDIGPDRAGARVFCRLDTRVFDDPLVDPTRIIDHLEARGLTPASLCLQLSERAPQRSPEARTRLVKALAGRDARIAIENFGAGVSGLHSLLTIDSHYIKIDRAFVAGVSSNVRKQTIVAKMIGLGHALGLQIIAEGVGSEADFRLLRDMGCDLIQGPLIAYTTPAAELRRDYSACCPLQVVTRAIPPRIAQLLIACEPLRPGDTLTTAVARFRQGVELGFLPVVDGNGHVQGAVYEEDLQPYIFGEHASALVKSDAPGQALDSVLRKCPISDATVSSEAIVDSFLVSPGGKGLVLTLGGVLAGVLGSQSILQLSWERALEEARDRNPLSALPGNRSIGEHLDFVLRVPQPRTLVFFDFDNFKCYNDVYGFAEGDRIILEFTRLLAELRHAHGAFIGHVGGDDFFASLSLEEAPTCALVAALLERFHLLAEACYRPEHRAQGGIWTNDRFGERRFFPLLRASAVVLELPSSRSHVTQGGIVSALADGKPGAKAAPDGLQRIALPTTAVAGEVDEVCNWPGARAPRSALG